MAFWGTATSAIELTKHLYRKVVDGEHKAGFISTNISKKTFICS